MPESAPQQLSPDEALELLEATQVFIDVTARATRLQLLQLQAARLFISPALYGADEARIKATIDDNAQSLGSAYNELKRAPLPLHIQDVEMQETALVQGIGVDEAGEYQALVGFNGQQPLEWPLKMGRQLILGEAAAAPRAAAARPNAQVISAAMVRNQPLTAGQICRLGGGALQ